VEKRENKQQTAEEYVKRYYLIKRVGVLTVDIKIAYTLEWRGWRMSSERNRKACLVVLERNEGGDKS